MRTFISVVVPVYNEDQQIEVTIKKIKDSLKKIEYDSEIIVVNDGSKDRTASKLRKITGITTLTHLKNKGYGASLKTGISKAKGNWILITDADGTYPIEDIPKLVSYINLADMIVGSRTGKNVKIPLFRKPIKTILNKFASYIAEERVPDINSGLRIFKKDLALRFWSLYPNKFSFTSTITLASMTHDYVVKYISINYYKRKGKSTIHPIKDVVRFLKLFMKLALFFRPLKVFIPLSAILFLGAIATYVLSLAFSIRLPDTTILLLTLSSVQIFVLGLIAELIVKTKNF